MKKAIVMGASSGIGREMALLLRESGWTVGVAARRTERLADFSVAARIDVTAEDAGAELQKLIGRLGGMDLYVHVSGIGRQNRELNEDTELQTVETNAMGFTRMVGTAFRYMATHGGGHIAVVSSIAGTKGLGPAPAYSATKALQNTYIEALEQLAHSRRLNIRFTDLRPGFVDTDLLNGTGHYPMLMDKQKVATACVRAITRQRHVHIIDWRWRIVTRFWQWVPRCLWRRLTLAAAVLLTISACNIAHTDSGTTAEGADSLYMAASDGDAKAQLKMGIRCDRDSLFAEAAVWYERAAMQGLAEAQNNLGVMLKDGQGVERDEAKAVGWFRRAARQGNVLAQSNLGWMFHGGRGVEQNYDSARHWYHKAALQGHAAAQNNLGLLFRDGLGLPQDSDSARHWFTLAAKQGLRQAYHNLEAMGY